ncbi:MAG: M23 family metallopeptidase [Acidaminococcaceae bacterium]|nr:M23 family metallopeptidase [Acidaminococcaceae bacterium]MDD4721274.1 M23 family metallopeptidase [Acidaminococcaceae bacterium]
MQEDKLKAVNASYLAFTWNRPGKESKIFSLGKKAVVALGLVAAIFVGAVAVGADLIYEAYGEKSELNVYRAQYAQYTERLQKLTDDSARMQKELAQVALLEAAVRKTLDKDGVAVSRGNIDRKSQELDLLGTGGGESAVDKLDILAVQNEMMDKRIAYKRENLSNMLNQLSNNDVGAFKWPTEGGEISSFYGYRVDPFGGKSGDFHPGIDIAAAYGTPIVAASAGKVEMAQWNGGYGRYVKLDNGNGYETAYGHMSAIAVSVGQEVRRGEVIGFVGSSGVSTGPHVHFEILEDGKTVNPLQFLQR